MKIKKLEHRVLSKLSAAQFFEYTVALAKILSCRKVSKERQPVYYCTGQEVRSFVVINTVAASPHFLLLYDT